MKRQFLCALALSAMAFTTSTASASTVNHTVYLNGFTYANPSVMTLQSAAPGLSIPAFNAEGGQYSGTLDGKSFISYCAEITQYLYFNTTYNDYQVVSGVAAWGLTKSLLIDHLISAIFDQHINTTSTGSSLTQAMLWETIYETSPTMGFATGSFNVTNTSNVQIASNGIDWADWSSWPISYHADLLHSVTAQDLFLITAVTDPSRVPEPSAPALLLVGMGALGLTLKRRSKTSS